MVLFFCAFAQEARASKIMASQVQSETGPPEFYDVCLLVDTSNLTLTLFSRGEPFRRYPVALGKPGTETPVGIWKVVDKSDIPSPGTGTRWMGLNVPGGNFGIHGTDSPWSIGSFASKGCIRMHNADIQEIYSWVVPGTWVVIVGNPFGQFGNDYPVLQEGDCHSAVAEVQYVLKRLGLYDGKPDSIFGPDTAKAVMKFRQKNGLPPGNYIDKDVYQLLGL